MKHILSTLSAPDAAQRLLGCELVRTIGAATVRVKIVETEAYDETDAASHSYKGRTARTDAMFGPSGHLYVYFTYGMHYCCNVVIGPKGSGAAVLIRAVEPLQGLSAMHANRAQPGVELCNGPAKLCQALHITKSLNGHDLDELPLKLVMNQSLDSKHIVVSKRIGISKAKVVAWRFYIQSNPYVSR